MVCLPETGPVGEIKLAKERIENLLEQYKFREALFEVIDLARKGNKYLQEKEPWKKNPVDSQELIDNCLHICLQLTANLAVLINPFLPNTAKKMLHLLKVVDKILDWENAGGMKLLSVGYTLRAPELLFRKIEDTEIEAQIQKLNANKMEKENELPVAGFQLPVTADLKQGIVFDDFSKIDLRVGTIISAKKVEKADKLLQLEVDLGFEKRTIVSGIALHFNAEDIIGKQVTVVVNLAPRKMKGIESNGMILMAEDKSGKLHFINPEGKIDEGSSVS